jgi:hypothetical protein
MSRTKQTARRVAFDPCAQVPTFEVPAPTQSLTSEAGEDLESEAGQELPPASEAGEDQPPRRYWLKNWKVTKRSGLKVRIRRKNESSAKKK